MTKHDRYIDELKAEAQDTVTPRQREIIKLLLGQSSAKTKNRKKPQ